MNWKFTYSCLVQKHVILLLLTGLPFISTAQIADNFSDGNFTTNPTWSGNDTHFQVNPNNQLQLNATGSGSSYLCLPNNQPLGNCEWSFWISLNFAPSSSNFARIYLASNVANLSGSLNGYYLQFGENLANDQVELFRQTGSSSVSICRATTNLSAAFAIGVKIKRDSVGLWSIWIDPLGNTNYSKEASGIDITHPLASFFGLYCEYTSSNATNFFFDDLYIYSPPDLAPAVLDSVYITSQNTLDLYFNETLSIPSAENTSNYSVNNGIGYASSAVLDSLNSNLAHLSFKNPFLNEEYYYLTVTGVQDLAGNNTINATFQFLFQKPQPNDLVINEVLFDPFDLGVEWVEVYNRSKYAIELKDVFLCSRDKDGVLDEIKQIAPYGYSLPSNTYLVLSKDASAIKAQYQTENPSGFIDMGAMPTLNNDSDKIVLMDASQMILDELHYYSDWHLPLLNDSKGFSLERVNYNHLSQDDMNWHTASERVGGATPAYENSQYTNGESSNELVLSPEVFSPDNDGYHDVLSISYSFDTPGMIGNIQIFDSRGKLEKILVQNELLASSGTFFWDGFNTVREKSCVGIYIVYFEAFDTKGEVKKIKKTCVLGSKL